MGDSNPFENPFADPSAKKIPQNQSTQQTLDDYNPFANQQQKPAAIIPTSSQPKANVQDVAPPNYTPSSSQNLDLNAIERQQEELNRRAAELDRREKAMNQPNAAEFKNFPPTPSWFPKPCQPCFYQDINREIPVEFQKWVRALFYLWIFHAAVLAFNIIAAMTVWISTEKGGTTFGFSILYFVLFTPLSYVCWFRPAYKGFRTDSSINFMIFFFIFFIQIIINVFEVVGFIDSGYCGLISSIDVSTHAVGTGGVIAMIFTWTATFLFAVLFGLQVLSGWRVHALYRNTGASFEKAQAEFASNVMANKNVQSAATTVITESARQAMNQQTNKYGGTGGKF